MTLTSDGPDAKNRRLRKDPEAVKAGGEGDGRGWDGWMALLTQWTGVWASSGSWWWTGRPGVLQSMGSQRVRHDWVTELNWTKLKNKRDSASGFTGEPSNGTPQADPLDGPSDPEQCSLLQALTPGFKCWRCWRSRGPEAQGFLDGASGKEPTCQHRRHKNQGFNP